MTEYRYYIKDIINNSDGNIILELGDIRGIPVFDFQPGQYVMIYYKDEKGQPKQKHTFSITSSPFENGTIRLGIRVLGPFTQGFMDMKKGDEIFVSGPYGNFTFKKDKHLDLVFVAGGVGITPFISAIRYATEKSLPNKMTLIYSNHSLKEALFLEEILELERRNKNLRVFLAVTGEKFSYEMKNLVNRRLDRTILKKFLGGTHGKTFFLCGPASFMEAMKKNLKGIGAYDFQIEAEGFSMIPDRGWWPKMRNTAYALAFSAAVFLLPFYFIHSAYKNAEASFEAPVTPEPDESKEIFVETPPSSPEAAAPAPKEAAISDSAASASAPNASVSAANDVSKTRTS